MPNWSSLTSHLGRIPDSVTLTFPELAKIVGGLPMSASKHRAWWSGDRTHVESWKSAGFELANLQMGSQVTFVRRGIHPFSSVANANISNIRSRPVVFNQKETEFVAADVVLIACVKTKMLQAALAKDLFISALFRKERAYAESSGVPWYILSAEHSLVAPEQWVAPYDRYLGNESSMYRESWGAKVVSEFERIEGPIQGKVIEIHAGAPYFDAIRHRLQSRGAIISDPLNGLRFGERLRWYGNWH